MRGGGREDRGVSLRTPLRAAALPLLALLLLLGVGAAPASAEPPFFLEDRVTDNAGVLDAGEVEDIEAAFAELQADEGITMFAVYGDSFEIGRASCRERE